MGRRVSFAVASTNTYMGQLGQPPPSSHSPTASLYSRFRDCVIWLLFFFSLFCCNNYLTDRAAQLLQRVCAAQPVGFVHQHVRIDAREQDGRAICGPERRQVVRWTTNCRSSLGAMPACDGAATVDVAGTHPNSMVLSNVSTATCQPTLPVIDEENKRFASHAGPAEPRENDAVDGTDIRRRRCGDSGWHLVGA